MLASCRTRVPVQAARWIIGTFVEAMNSAISWLNIVAIATCRRMVVRVAVLHRRVPKLAVLVVPASSLVVLGHLIPVLIVDCALIRLESLVLTLPV